MPSLLPWPALGLLAIVLLGCRSSWGAGYDAGGSGAICRPLHHSPASGHLQGHVGLCDPPHSAPVQVGSVPEQKPFPPPPYSWGLRRGAASGPPGWVWHPDAAPTWWEGLHTGRTGSSPSGQTQVKSGNLSVAFGLLAGGLSEAADLAGSSQSRIPKQLGSKSPHSPWLALGG